MGHPLFASVAEAPRKQHAWLRLPLYSRPHSDPDSISTALEGPPNGSLDFSATGSRFFWWADQEPHDFADDPEGPRPRVIQGRWLWGHTAGIAEISTAAPFGHQGIAYSIAGLQPAPSVRDDDFRDRVTPLCLGLFGTNITSGVKTSPLM